MSQNTNLEDEGKRMTIQLQDGQRMPQVFLGTYLLGEQETSDLIQDALEVGYRAIDSAEWYENEKGCGMGVLAYLERHPNVTRSDIYFLTKLKTNVSYEATRASIDESLKLCGLGYIDMYLLHSPYGGPKARSECYQAMIDAMKQGQIKAVGVSNFGISHLKELLSTFPDFPPLVNQIELNPFNRQLPIVSFCQEHNIILQAFTPTTATRRLTHPAVIKLASEYDKTPAQILIRWSLQQGFVPLPKTVRKSRLVENYVGILDWSLSLESLKELDELDEHLVCDWDPTGAE